ncbi:uncharacterized protein [Dermacentor albipictus]|uniref:uncharacterized protein n=1 Tax=Dermacentor albipictus TaxID=60249 RepID=UPI0038FC9161
MYASLPTPVPSPDHSGSPERQLIVTPIGVTRYCKLWIVVACSACLAGGFVLRMSNPTQHPGPGFLHAVKPNRRVRVVPKSGYQPDDLTPNATGMTDMEEARMIDETEPFAATGDWPDATSQAADVTAKSQKEHVSTPESSSSVTPSTPAYPTAEQPNAILLQPKIAKASSVSGALSEQPLSSSQLPHENVNFKSRAFHVISSGLADIARKIPSADTLPVPRAASHVPGSASSIPKKEGMNVAHYISTRLETATHSHESQRDPPRHVISIEERSDDDAKSGAGPGKARATRCYCEAIREDLSSDAASSPTESTPLEHVAEGAGPEVNGPTTASENAASSLSKLTPLEHVAESGGPEARGTTPASDDTAKGTWSAVVTKQDTFEMTSLLPETSAGNKTYAPPYDFDATRKKPYSGDQVMCNSSFCLHEELLHKPKQP